MALTQPPKASPWLSHFPLQLLAALLPPHGLPTCKSHDGGTGAVCQPNLGKPSQVPPKPNNVGKASMLASSGR